LYDPKTYGFVSILPTRFRFSYHVMHQPWPLTSELDIKNMFLLLKVIKCTKLYDPEAYILISNLLTSSGQTDRQTRLTLNNNTSRLWWVYKNKMPFNFRCKVMKILLSIIQRLKWAISILIFISSVIISHQIAAPDLWMTF
jgi:hypothetical protein